MSLSCRPWEGLRRVVSAILGPIEREGQISEDGGRRGQSSQLKSQREHKKDWCKGQG